MFGVGLVVLVGGAELLVRGTAKLGSALGIAPLVIGLTIVAWGTSAPELAVNLQSTAQGVPRVALGNVVGSNIFNVLVILGLSALAAPLVVARQIVRRDVPIMIAVSILLLLLALDGEISRIEGLILLVIMAGYTAWSIRPARGSAGSNGHEAAETVPGRNPIGRAALASVPLILLGLGLLALGAGWLVAGAVAIAEALEVSKLVVGLTIVAAGTSLPEAATSVVASLRGERDLAVGNVVGSNIFNILAVLGLTACFAPSGIPVPLAALHFDIPVMIAVAVACLPISLTGCRISKWEGAFFLAYYLAFITYIVLDAAQHEAMPAYLSVMKWFVVPITVTTLLVISVSAFREQQLRAREPRSHDPET